jgi:hypothetical protein
MTLKIEKSESQGSTALTLSGQIEAEHISELRGILQLQKGDRDVMLDLQEVRLADREAVTFLSLCEMDGVKLKNCPAYIREWIDRERKRK